MTRKVKEKISKATPLVSQEHSNNPLLLAQRVIKRLGNTTPPFATTPPVTCPINLAPLTNQAPLTETKICFHIFVYFIREERPLAPP